MDSWAGLPEILRYESFDIFASENGLIPNEDERNFPAPPELPKLDFADLQNTGGIIYCQKVKFIGFYWGAI